LRIAEPRRRLVMTQSTCYPRGNPIRHGLAAILQATPSPQPWYMHLWPLAGAWWEGEDIDKQVLAL
ncbi:hypothetical protein J6590_079097, partial [Homalodisca vitripennis]